MSGEEAKKLKELLVLTASYYRQELPDGALILQVGDLMDLPFEAVTKALENYRKDPKHTNAPLPAKLRSLIQSGLTRDDEARILAGKIWQCIGKFGSYRGGDAKEFLGEVGWKTVELLGGWEAICKTEVSDRGVFIAQARDLSMSLIASQQLHGDLSLPSPKPSFDPKTMPKAGYSLGIDLGQRDESVEVRLQDLLKSLPEKP